MDHKAQPATPSSEPQKCGSDDEHHGSQEADSFKFHCAFTDIDGQSRTMTLSERSDLRLLLLFDPKHRNHAEMIEEANPGTQMSNSIDLDVAVDRELRKVILRMVQHQRGSGPEAVASLPMAGLNTDSEVVAGVLETLIYREPSLRMLAGGGCDTSDEQTNAVETESPDPQLGHKSLHYVKSMRLPESKANGSVAFTPASVITRPRHFQSQSVDKRTDSSETAADTATAVLADMERGLKRIRTAMQQQMTDACGGRTRSCGGRTRLRGRNLSAESSDIGPDVVLLEGDHETDDSEEEDNHHAHNGDQGDHHESKSPEPLDAMKESISMPQSNLQAQPSPAASAVHAVQAMIQPQDVQAIMLGSLPEPQMLPVYRCIDSQERLRARTAEMCRRVLMKAPHARTLLDLYIVDQALDTSKMISIMSPQARLELCRYMKYKFLPEGSTLFRQGDRGGAFYVVLQGKLTITIREATYRFSVDMNGGDSFGELSLLTLQPRAGMAVAAGPCALMYLEAGRFREIMAPALQDAFDHVIEFLSGIDLIKRTSRTSLEKTTYYLRPVIVEPGATLLSEGEVASAVYFVKSGTCEVHMQYPPMQSSFQPIMDEVLELSDAPALHAIQPTVAGFAQYQAQIGAYTAEQRANDDAMSRQTAESATGSSPVQRFAIGSVGPGSILGLPALQQHAERATFTATSRLELFAITPEYFRKRFDGGIAKAAARLQRVQGSAWCARFLHSCDALHLPIPHWLQLLAKHANLNVASAKVSDKETYFRSKLGPDGSLALESVRYQRAPRMSLQSAGVYGFEDAATQGPLAVQSRAFLPNDGKPYPASYFAAALGQPTEPKQAQKIVSRPQRPARVPPTGSNDSAAATSTSVPQAATPAKPASGTVTHVTRGGRTYFAPNRYSKIVVDDKRKPTSRTKSGATRQSAPTSQRAVPVHTPVKPQPTPATRPPSTAAPELLGATNIGFYRRRRRASLQHQASSALAATMGGHGAGVDVTPLWEADGVDLTSATSAHYESPAPISQSSDSSMARPRSGGSSRMSGGRCLEDVGLTGRAADTANSVTRVRSHHSIAQDRTSLHTAMPKDSRPASGRSTAVTPARPADPVRAAALERNLRYSISPGNLPQSQAQLRASVSRTTSQLSVKAPCKTQPEFLPPSPLQSSPSTVSTPPSPSTAPESRQKKLLSLQRHAQRGVGSLEESVAHTTGLGRAGPQRSNDGSVNASGFSTGLYSGLVGSASSYGGSRAQLLDSTASTKYSPPQTRHVPLTAADVPPLPLGTVADMTPPRASPHRASRAGSRASPRPSSISPRLLMPTQSHSKTGNALHTRFMGDLALKMASCAAVSEACHDAGHRNTPSCGSHSARRSSTGTLRRSEMSQTAGEVSPRPSDSRSVLDTRTARISHTSSSLHNDMANSVIKTAGSRLIAYGSSDLSEGQSVGAGAGVGAAGTKVVMPRTDRRDRRHSITMLLGATKASQERTKRKIAARHRVNSARRSTTDHSPVRMSTVRRSSASTSGASSTGRTTIHEQGAGAGATGLGVVKAQRRGMLGRAVPLAGMHMRTPARVPGRQGSNAVSVGLGARSREATQPTPRDGLGGGVRSAHPISTLYGASMVYNDDWNFV